MTTTNTTTNKRLEMLEKLSSTGKADSFGLYALAMEYRKAGRPSDALRTFETLRECDPEYLAMYLMAGQLLSDEDRDADARVWLEQGIALATKKGDGKARSELMAALEACEG
ncbi:MAG TPA: tetratricopeptide repeat protein [Polyangiaceae bacterium]